MFPATDDSDDSGSSAGFDREVEAAMKDMRYEKLSDMTKEQLIDLVMVREHIPTKNCICFTKKIIYNVYYTYILFQEVEGTYEEQTSEVSHLQVEIYRLKKVVETLKNLSRDTVGVRKDKNTLGYESS